MLLDGDCEFRVGQTVQESLSSERERKTKAGEKSEVKAGTVRSLQSRGANRPSTAIIHNNAM